MMPLVIDTSVVVKWLNQDNEKYIDKADKILEDAKNYRVELWAPELVKYEIGNVLLYGKKITTRNIEHLFHIFYSLPINFIPENKELACNTFMLAQNLGITYYDASFLAVAKQYNATLVTEDLKHQGKSKQIKVKSLQDY